MKKLFLICLSIFFAFQSSFAQEKSMGCTPTVVTGDPIQIGGGLACPGAAGQVQFNGTNYQVWDPTTSSWVTFGNPATSNLWTINSNGQDIFRSSRNVGIGSVFNSVTAALSPLSVGGQGNNNYAAYFTRSANINGAVAVFGELPRLSGAGSDNGTGVYGTVEAGFGFTRGVVGNSSTPNPVGSGRATGVLGVAGNATTGYNYGVVGRLAGDNNGAGIVGVDGDLYAVEGANPIAGKWAGYFWGNSYFSDQVIIGRQAIPTNIAGTCFPAPGIDVTAYQLFVEGGILTEKIVLAQQSCWADYVFTDDYNLLSLEEVEQHIEDNGHLPNTPSATEVEEQGMDIAEITINQQEKIEELFLHVIELNKQVKALQAENAALREGMKH
ncbi:MAG: hypothetical protein AB8G22_20200 [Saprospiraceae bacterium]